MDFNEKIDTNHSLRNDQENSDSNFSLRKKNYYGAVKRYYKINGYTPNIINHSIVPRL